MKDIWNGSVVFFGTKDLKKTHEFYSGILGLKLYLDQKGCLIYNVNGGGMIGFCEHLERIQVYKSPIITLVTEKVDEIYDLIVSKNFNPITSPEKNEKYNIYHFFMKDPNGYTLEIQKFL